MPWRERRASSAAWRDDRARLREIGVSTATSRSDRLARAARRQRDQRTKNMRWPAGPAARYVRGEDHRHGLSLTFLRRQVSTARSKEGLAWRAARSAGGVAQDLVEQGAAHHPSQRRLPACFSPPGEHLVSGSCSSAGKFHSFSVVGVQIAAPPGRLCVRRLHRRRTYLCAARAVGPGWRQPKVSSTRRWLQPASGNAAADGLRYPRYSKPVNRGRQAAISRSAHRSAASRPPPCRGACGARQWRWRMAGRSEVIRLCRRRPPLNTLGLGLVLRGIRPEDMDGTAMCWLAHARV